MDLIADMTGKRYDTIIESTVFWWLFIARPAFTALLFILCATLQELGYMDMSALLQSPPEANAPLSTAALFLGLYVATALLMAVSMTIFLRPTPNIRAFLGLADVSGWTGSYIACLSWCAILRPAVAIGAGMTYGMAQALQWVQPIAQYGADLSWNGLRIMVSSLILVFLLYIMAGKAMAAVTAASFDATPGVIGLWTEPATKGPKKD